VLEASKRTRFYLPLNSWSLKIAQSFGPASAALLARSRKKLQKDDLQGAWDDGRAVLRLGCLAAQYGTILFDIMGQTMRKQACQIAFDIAKSGKLRKADGLRIISDFGNPPSIPSPLELLSIERLVFLDMGLIACRDGGATIDRNIVLQEMNRGFDLWEAALAKKGYAAQSKEMESVVSSLVEEVEEATKGAKNILLRLFRLLEGSSRRRRHLSESIAKPIIAMISKKDSGTLLRSRADVETRSGLTVISLALAAWKVDHGTFPDGMDSLSPEYLNPVPLDPFTDQPFIYRRTEKGYILYSLWWNLKDDGGGERDMVLKVE
jgi:hypothetical protein